MNPGSRAGGLSPAFEELAGDQEMDVSLLVREGRARFLKRTSAPPPTLVPRSLGPALAWPIVLGGRRPCTAGSASPAEAAMPSRLRTVLCSLPPAGVSARHFPRACENVQEHEFADKLKERFKSQKAVSTFKFSSLLTAFATEFPGFLRSRSTRSRRARSVSATERGLRSPHSRLARLGQATPSGLAFPLLESQPTGAEVHSTPDKFRDSPSPSASRGSYTGARGRGLTGLSW